MQRGTVLSDSTSGPTTAWTDARIQPQTLQQYIACALRGGHADRPSGARQEHRAAPTAPR